MARDPRGPRVSRFERVVLVDAAPYVFRAYYALPSRIADREGRPANATFGFLDTLLGLLEEEEGAAFAVAFDGPTDRCFRTAWLPGYKADREETPEDLGPQFEDCRALVRALGLALLEHEEYEADDAIATVHRRLARRADRMVVVTNDKDLAQLVGPQTEWYDLARGERLGPDEVRRRLGVRPDQVADYLALAGDPVDCIPGVCGVGPKTAAALLEAFGDLDALYADLDRVESLPLRGAAAVRRRLEAGREDAYLGRRLATLAADVPLGRVDLRRRPDPAALEALLERLGFGRLRERALRWAAAPGS